MKKFDIENKVIVVTGAAGFVGNTLLESLEQENAKPIGLDVICNAKVRDVDITDEMELEELVTEISKTHGKIDGLVNNAALSFKGVRIEDNKFNDVLNVNIKGAYNMINAFKPIMNSGASVVNISSIYGSCVPEFSIYEGNENEFSNVSYGLSKAAIEQMTRYYTKLYGTEIRMNAVAPGGIYRNQSDDFIEKYSRRVPLGRMANVQEIVNTILFLLSPLSSYVAGHTLMVDGGLSAW